MNVEKILDAVLAQHVAIVGKTGAGKTSTEKLAVEHVVAAGARVCVLDTIKSDWWGITSSASGKRAGLPFRILGGPRGHVPLHSNAGKVIGNLVATGKLPLSVIDMADFEAGGVQRFFVDFAQSLFRNMRGVVYLVIEEAHEVAPKERAGFGAENLSIHWAKKLSTGGRSKGIRLIVATQRVQSLHNAVLGSCETIIAHRLTTPADQEPILKWLKANADKETQAKVAESMSSLPTGTGYVCSGEAKIFERVAFPKFKTYDNSKTPTGEEAEIDVATAPVDQDELRSIIGDAVTAAEADDPKALRKRIAEKDREISNLKTSRPSEVLTDPNEIASAEERGFGQAERKLKAAMQREVHRKIKEALAVVRKHAADAIDRVDDELREINAKDAKLSADFELPPAPKSVAPRAVPSVPPRMLSGIKPIAKNGNAAGIDRSLQKIVDAIRWWNVMGVPAPSHAQVAFVAGYSHKSGTWSTYLSRLRSGAYIEGRGDLILTAQGAAVANEPIAPPSGDQLRATVIGKVDNSLAKILGPIIDAHPNGLTHEEAGAAAGYSPTSGTWSTYLSRLRSLELIEGRGELRAQDWLFP
ncbi:MAG TPA: DUF87 domain-containing protein [Xanthobacteraceae bacterium]|nr:DUF87 domain-containing protein [Xanthobacteraceae bacterium]